MVPHLTTALTGPINELEARMLESVPAIERWFRLEWMEHTPPFYAAVDLRNAGFKLAPVDTDLFPSRFNGLTPQMLPLAVQAAMAAIEKICPEAKNLLLVPGVAWRNTYYQEHLQTLVQVFTQAGLNVRVGSLDRKLNRTETFVLPDGSGLQVQPLVRGKRRLGVDGFDPCTILLNHDLAEGVPGLLEDLHEQYLLPPLHAAASQRRKSTYFQSYEEVARKFAKLLGMDPWLLHPLHGRCGEVDLSSEAGIECLKAQADAVLAKVRRKHKEYGIRSEAFVIIKADGGRSGQGVVSLRSSAELDDPQRRQRIIDAQVLPSEVIVQEGVPTHERVSEAVAEPVVYTIDRYVVGGMYRVHAERGVEESLDAPGTIYAPLAFAETARLPQPGERPGASAPNRFYMYGVVARLALLAAAYELEATDPDAERFE